MNLMQMKIAKVKKMEVPLTVRMMNILRWFTRGYFVGTYYI